MVSEQERTILRELSRPSAGRFLAAILFDWACIVAAVVLAGVIDQWWAYVVASAVIGARQHALTLMGHEGTHYSFSLKHRRLNDWVTNVTAMWPCMAPLDGYRKFHWDHHRFLGTNADPERRHREMAPEQWTLPATKNRVVMLSLLDLCGGGLLEFGRLVKAVPAISMSDRLGPLAWWLPVGTLLYMAGYGWVIALWFVSLLTWFVAFFRARIWTEHIGIDGQGRKGSHLMEANALERFTILPHYTWLHYEHHVWPSVPCWNLARLRRELVRESPQRFWELVAAYEGRERAGVEASAHR